MQTSIKAMIGQKFKDPEFQKEVIKDSLYAMKEGKGGLAEVKVSWLMYLHAHAIR